MDYYGLLFLYYLKGLSGKSVLRLFFNIEVDGTEQLLPENTSTPTTTPILADIQYPDGLRTDQYFTYRETPTTVSNKARIKTIKGNTLVWNQLVKNGNFADISNWGTYQSSFTVSGNIATIVGSGNNANINQTINCVPGHKYYAKADLKGNTSTRIIITGTDLSEEARLTQSENYETVGVIFTVSASTLYFNISQAGNPITFYAKNAMLFDLTQMGLDITASDFTSFFSLSYYAYNQGTLLSFMGNGIKTVGKNLLMPTATFPQTLNGVTFTLNSDGSVTANGTAGSGDSTLIYWDKNTYGGKLLADGTYKLSGITSGSASTYSIRTNGFGGISITGGEATLTITDSLPQTNVIIVISNGVTVNNVVFKPMIRRANVTDNTFKPYTSSTLSLPISTYFPNGMKSAGTAYDELTPTKAITRIGTVDMGTLSWSHNSTYEFFYANLLDAPPFTEALQKTLVCPIYETGTTVNSASQMANIDNKTIRGRRDVAYTQIYVKDTSYSSATDLVNALQGILLYYELATPTETPITTEDANEALSLLMGRSVSSSNAKQMIDIITKGE